MFPGSVKEIGPLGGIFDYLKGLLGAVNDGVKFHIGPVYGVHLGVHLLKKPAMDRLPELFAYQHHRYLVGYLLGLDEGQYLKGLVQRAQPPGKEYIGPSRV